MTPLQTHHTYVNPVTTRLVFFIFTNDKNKKTPKDRAKGEGAKRRMSVQGEGPNRLTLGHRMHYEPILRLSLSVKIGNISSAFLYSAAVCTIGK
jgi:hypothetical protein